jgi:hypothetical protein
MVAITPRFAAAVACLLARSDAFAPSLVGRAVNVNNYRGPTGGRPLFAEGGDGPKDGTTITSARKEIGYDANSGRFFETDIDPEDCIPDSEYCVIDKVSGAPVRLTLEEKERIFLDALQVRVWCVVDGCIISRRPRTIRCFISNAHRTCQKIVLLYQWTAAPQRCGFRSLERGPCLEWLRNGEDESPGDQVPRGGAGILEGNADPFGRRVRSA